MTPQRLIHLSIGLAVILGGCGGNQGVDVVVHTGIIEQVEYIHNAPSFWGARHEIILHFNDNTSITLPPQSALLRLHAPAVVYLNRCTGAWKIKYEDDE